VEDLTYQEKKLYLVVIKRNLLKKKLKKIKKKKLKRNQEKVYLEKVSNHLFLIFVIIFNKMYKIMMKYCLRYLTIFIKNVIIQLFEKGKRLQEST